MTSPQIFFPFVTLPLVPLDCSVNFFMADKITLVASSQTKSSNINEPANPLHLARTIPSQPRTLAAAPGWCPFRRRRRREPRRVGHGLRLASGWQPRHGCGGHRPGRREQGGGQRPRRHGGRPSPPRVRWPPGTRLRPRSTDGSPQTQPYDHHRFVVSMCLCAPGENPRSSDWAVAALRRRDLLEDEVLESHGERLSGGWVVPLHSPWQRLLRVLLSVLLVWLVRGAAARL